jgi:electron transfer flavoprotein alpha subunit
MADVVVFCESDEKGIRSASLPALTAGAALAKQLGGGVCAVVIGSGTGAAAADAARYAARVLAYDDARLAAPLAETWAPQLADAVKRAGAGALLGTATSTGKDILPRAAALLGAGMASDITAVVAANRFRRPAYAGNAIEEVRSPARSWSPASARPPSRPRRPARPARSRRSRSPPSTRWARSSSACTKPRARAPISARPRWSSRAAAE